jgi:hypothetical protein
MVTRFDIAFVGSTRYEIAEAEEIFAGTRYVPGKNVGFNE